MRKLAITAILATSTTVLAAATAPARPLGKIIVKSGESIQCPAGSAACVVTVRATGRDRHNRRVALGHSTTTVDPAGTAKLVFRLSAAGKHLLLSRGPLRASLTVTVRDGPGAPIVSTHPITIGVPKRHGHRR